MVIAVVLLGQRNQRDGPASMWLKSDVLGLMACDGVGVQWQNGDLCVDSLVFAVLCGNQPPLCGTLKFFTLALLVCEFEDRRALCKNRKHKHKHTWVAHLGFETLGFRPGLRTQVDYTWVPHLGAAPGMAKSQVFPNH